MRINYDVNHYSINSIILYYLYLSLIICKFAKMVFICVSCVYVALTGLFLSKKSPQKSIVIVVCSGLERIGKSLKIPKNGWLCEALES